MNEMKADIAKRIRSWEIMRLIYNAILAPVGIAAIHHARHTPTELIRTQPPMEIPQIVLGSIAFGVFANVMFTLGPIFETYLISLTRFNMKKSHRIVLFTIGLLLSLAVTVGTVAVLHPRLSLK